MAMLWRILSFNVGVELGQIAALTVMVGARALWRQRPSFKRFSYAANLALFYGGVYLLLDGKKGKEWKATFTNPAAADKTKQNLYVFFSHPGNFIAANFTGQ